MCKSLNKISGVGCEKGSVVVLFHRDYSDFFLNLLNFLWKFWLTKGNVSEKTITSN